MATIDSKDVIDKIIADDGYCEDDPRVIRITQYINAWGKTAYGVVWQGELDIYRYERETEYVRSPKVIFNRT